MQTDPTWMAQRAIVLQLLRDDHDERWTVAELEHEISDFDPQVVGDGLGRLRAEGVAVILDEHVLASRCAHRLDDLELIGV